MKTKTKFIVAGILLLTGLVLLPRVTEQHHKHLNKYEVSAPTPGKYSPIVRILDKKDFVCSGVVISNEYVLTAAHCVTNMIGLPTKTKMTVQTMFPDNLKVEVEVVAREELRDVALLRGNFTDFATVPADFSGTLFSMQVQEMMPAQLCGFPGGQKELFCSTAALKGNMNFRFTGFGGILFQGMSGGPVMINGIVIGVNSAVNGNMVVVAPLVGLLAVWEMDDASKSE